MAQKYEATLLHEPRHVLALATCLLAAVLFLAPAPAGAAQVDWSDGDVRGAVVAELILDPAIVADSIEVAVVSGVVKLYGEVDNILTKERAVKRAQLVKGVRAVVDRIEVVPPVARGDEEIRDAVITALATDPATDSYEIGVAAQGGKVTLAGKVDSWAERDLAEKVAKGVRGVLSVENDIQVEFAKPRTDAEIANDVRQRLHWNVLVDDALIGVDVENGTVRLSGLVASVAEKARAESLARVAGAIRVDASALDVGRWTRDPDLRAGKFTGKSDAEIQAALRRALQQDPRVLAFNVAPTVTAGIVTLHGKVDNLKAKRAAGQTARNTVGVVGVRNHLMVRPAAYRDDEAIARAVRSAEARHPNVDLEAIDVSVTNGVVTLNGTVDSYHEKMQAEDVASRVNGVVAIQNRLLASNTQVAIAFDPYVDEFSTPGLDAFADRWVYTTKTDREIRESINDQLFWSPFVDADQVNVSVLGGVVTLSGEVDSWVERQMALENAFEGGAIWVHNQIEVKPGG